jgi:hypothetical protein
MQMPDQTNREFVLQLAGPVRSGQIFLETRNGDNPPIDLHNFRVFYPVSRILFKATTNEPDFLYYGNAKVAQPQYDLSLVGNQLVKAAKSTATLSAEERLKGSALSDSRQSGAGSVALWSTLALVVVVLLWLIARLLPKSPPP